MVVKSRTRAATREGEVQLEPDLELVLDMLRRLSYEAGLTPTVEQRLIELALGLSNKGIASKHGISVNTVKTQVKTLLRAFDLDCRHEIEHAVRGALGRLQGGLHARSVEVVLRLCLDNRLSISQERIPAQVCFDDRGAKLRTVAAVSGGMRRKQ